MNLGQKTPVLVGRERARWRWATPRLGSGREQAAAAAARREIDTHLHVNIYISVLHAILCSACGTLCCSLCLNKLYYYHQSHKICFKIIPSWPNRRKHRKQDAWGVTKLPEINYATIRSNYSLYSRFQNIKYNFCINDVYIALDTPLEKLTYHYLGIISVSSSLSLHPFVCSPLWSRFLVDLSNSCFIASTHTRPVALHHLAGIREMAFRVCALIPCFRDSHTHFPCVL